MTTRVLNVVTNVGHYDGPSHATGLWLSELTHAWHVFEEHGYDRSATATAACSTPGSPTALTSSPAAR
ncbi:hypothetical protein [Streptomyces griseorubiginosus]|uniref:hypothetical protein n=1 Tax=Streptomyces griseorubiginosus TaxID=67304 RepID=UPI00215A85A2